MQEASADVGSTAKTRPADSAASITRRVTTPAPQRIVELLHQMQTDLRERAQRFRDANLCEVNTWDDFQEQFQGERAPGFVLAHWDGTRETEDQIAEQTKATIRCIPFDRKKEPGKCILTGRPSEGRVVFAKAY